MSNSPAISGFLKLMHAEQKVDNLQVIIDYLIADEGTIELSELQQKIYERLDTADNLIRSRLYKNQTIIRILTKKYNYSPTQARRDIADAQHVFGSVRGSNKKYLLARHVERIEDAMVWAQTHQPKLIPLLMREYTRAVLSMPDDEKPHTTPAAIIFNISQNNYTQLTGQEMTEDRAGEIAREKIKQLGIDIEDIEIEE